MVVQAQTIGPGSNSLVASDNGIVLDGSVQTISGEGHVPKIRKPYTITKQRERWTEDEHKKFLEALKLYGRAWRKIEEHVGTKTAVQIRSHAQKFFSKVVRESSSNNTVSVEAIEIPPPRPKRKPIHPYPRKLVPPPRKESSPADQPARSTSPHSSLSEQENQSPTSVLSAVISDTVGSADSTPNGSPSPSSDNFVSQVDFLTPQDTELHLCKSASEDDVSVKLELFPNVDAFDKEDVDCGKVLKLFGRDLVVPNKLSSNTLRCSDMGEGVLQSFQEDSKCIDLALGISECSSNEFEGRNHSMGGSSNHVEKPIPLPWWVFFKDMPMHPFVTQAEAEVPQEKDGQRQREGSCAASNSGSVNDTAKADKSWDAETQSSLKPKKAAALLEKRSTIEKSPKGGFMPYKRCLSDRDLTSSSITTAEERGQRIRLCL